MRLPCVWSKVIATVITFILGTTVTSIYAIFKTAYSKTPFKETFVSAYKLLISEMNLPIWTLLSFLLIFVIFTIKPFIAFTRSLINKFDTLRTSDQDETEAPMATEHSTVLFSYRMARTFPGLRGIEWFESPNVAVKRLELLLKTPLVFSGGWSGVHPILSGGSGVGLPQILGHLKNLTAKDC